MEAEGAKGAEEAEGMRGLWWLNTRNVAWGIVDFCTVFPGSCLVINQFKLRYSSTVHRVQCVGLVQKFCGHSMKSFT